MCEIRKIVPYLQGRKEEHKQQDLWAEGKEREWDARGLRTRAGARTGATGQSLSLRF